MAASVNVVANPSRRSYSRRRYRRPARYSRRRAAYSGRRSYGRRRRYGGGSRRPVMRRRARFSKFLLAQVDPFDERAQGAKIPDSNTMPSSAFAVNDETNLATGATWTCAAAAYGPNMNNIRYVATPASNTTWSWGGEGSGDISTRAAGLIGQYKMYRVAAHGVRISVPTSVTSTVGFLHVAVYPNDFFQAAALPFPQSLGQLNQCTWYKRFTLSSLTQQTLTVVNKIMDVNAQLYRDINVSESNASSTNSNLVAHTFGFATIIVALEGVPVGTTAIAVEHISLCEGIPLATGIVTPTPAADFNPEELGVASKIGAKQDAVMLQTEREQHLSEAAKLASPVPQTLSGKFYDAAVSGLGRVVDSVGPAAFEAGANYLLNNALPGQTNVNRLALT